MDAFLTVAEISELLKVNQQTVRNWIDRGELQAVRIGSRRVRIREEELEAFIDGGGVPELEKLSQTIPSNRRPTNRTELEAAIENARVAVTEGSDHQLAAALGRLADAASRLSNELEGAARSAHSSE